MASLKPLAGKVCIVTGATRGIGKGIALQLGAAGATVYITGRTLKKREGDPVGGSLEETASEVKKKGGDCIPVQCDHSKDNDIKALFDRVSRDQDGQLDVLVNNAYSGVQAIANAYKKPFWEQDPGVWDEINVVGLRNHYICSVYAAKLMVPRKRGLIVNVSSAGGLSYLFNVAYGVGKEGCDRMAVDCAIELKKHNVAFVSLWPGAVRTENLIHIINEKGFGEGKDVKILEEAFTSGETPEYAGLAVTHLAADPNVMKKTGRILIAADLGNEYGFVDVDGVRRSSMRELGFALSFTTKSPIFKKIIPSFVRIPCWMLSLAGNKF
ncbi:dehydrogenase/reductase SDR family member 1-like [Littorina saxatilis]|uniref:dehydrogenase/reductase SDR family member 1-like n=1 Tax=Littorina saxatilis TaxID=31220 RepID=UPI0038B687FC